MPNPAMKGGAGQGDQLSDLRAQIEAQRKKRHAMADRLRQATSEAAEGTPADSKIFRLFTAKAEETQVNGKVNHINGNGNGNGNGHGSHLPASTPVVYDEDSEAVPTVEDLIKARRARKKGLADLKKTTMGVVAYRETQIFNKNKI